MNGGSLPRLSNLPPCPSTRTDNASATQSHRSAPARLWRTLFRDSRFQGANFTVQVSSCLKRFHWNKTVKMNKTTFKSSEMHELLPVFVLLLPIQALASSKKDFNNAWQPNHHHHRDQNHHPHRHHHHLSYFFVLGCCDYHDYECLYNHKYIVISLLRTCYYLSLSWSLWLSEVHLVLILTN